MLLKFLISPKCGPNFSCFIPKRYQTQQLALIREEEAKYPPIIDSTFSGKQRHRRQLWYDSIKTMPTVEQKLHEIVTKYDLHAKIKFEDVVNKHEFYYSQVHHMGACSPSYVGIPFQHYVTRTHVIQGLPEKISNLNVDDMYTSLKSVLCEALENSLTNIWREKRLSYLTDSEENSGRKVIDNLISNCLRNLINSHPHLLETAYDEQPNVTSYWFHDGFKSPDKYIIPDELFKSPLRPWKREIISLNRQLAAENLCFQFQDHPYCTIRLNKPLPSVVSSNDPLCSTAEVVDYNYSPTILGFTAKTKYNINTLPGLWSGDPYEFPLLQIYTSDKMKTLLSTLDHHSMENIEDGLAVMASFGWLNGLASNLGFTPYHDLTYPIVGQTVVTNGQDWTFYVYQLNTISFHADVDNKDRRNLCWCSGKMKLFEMVEDGKVKGVNDDVLKTLIKFFVHQPDASNDVCLKPYLGKDTRTEEERETLQAELRKIYRNGFDSKAFLEEVPLWQQIYKFHPEAPPCPSIRLK